MLHVSTRGEAPALSFSDALLTGLARDGGLYLPQSWPKVCYCSKLRLSKSFLVVPMLLI